ncbi:hypothetical protein HJG60_010453 [Phyllostomus discolor]|uniref:Uncharacterized protein n=1 Tax=Phyllostomus discolor TaxID=89673 RepID=A0A834EEV6_9CHIR|nr:hypothetical protein HJG60_010453 [Phyllostomus discolor]
MDASHPRVPESGKDQEVPKRGVGDPIDSSVAGIAREDLAAETRAALLEKCEVSSVPLTRPGAGPAGAGGRGPTLPSTDPGPGHRAEPPPHLWEPAGHRQAGCFFNSKSETSVYLGKISNGSNLV